MKNNSVKLWEEYIEYAALAVAILVLVWFAWGAFGTSIEVKVGKRVVTTTTVDADLIEVAKGIAPKQSDSAPSPMEIIAPDPLGVTFSNRASKNVSPNPKVVFPALDMSANVNKDQEILAELVLYATPIIAAPEDVRARQWFGTIRDSELDRVSDLLDVVDGPPYDSSWIQVDATFDIDAVVEAFEVSSEDMEAVPDRWYDGGADILDIQIQRQRLQAGIWSEPETISLLPGHLQYRDRVEEGTIDSSEKEKIIRNLRGGLQGEITRPAYYLCKNNQPSEDDLDPATWDDSIKEMTEKDRLQKKLQIHMKKISKQQKLIETIQTRIDDPSSGSGGGAPAMGGGGPMGGGGNSGGTSKRDRLQKQLANANEKMLVLFEKKQVLEDEIEAIGASEETEEEVILSGEIRVWGHDMTAIAGNTYRYRMQVQLGNPFFGHKPSLFPEQKGLAEKVTIASLQSPWSSKIEIQNPIQWFVVNARNAGESMNPDALDSGFVTIENFAFSDGLWVQETFIVQVGQRVGKLDDAGEPVDWFVLDILEDAVGDLVILQHVTTGDLMTMYPSAESQKTELHLLRQQVRQQVDEEQDANPDEPVEPPTGSPGGPIGTGGGGSML